MRSTLSAIVLVPLLAVLSAVSVAASPDERAALMAVDAHFAAEVAAKGFAAFEGFFADDAVYLPNYAPRIEGKTAIMDSMRPLFGNPKMKLTWTPLRADIAKSGDLGWTTGSYQSTSIDDQGGTRVTRGKYVTIWRKQADGSWKAVLDGGNTDAPPQPRLPAGVPSAPAGEPKP